VSLGLLYEFPRLHSDTPHSVGLLWTSDQPDTETPTWQHTTPRRNSHPRLQQDSDPQSQRSFTHALDRATIGIVGSSGPITKM